MGSEMCIRDRCDAAYNASEGYRFRKCFENYGGISSLNSTCTAHSDETLKTVFIDSDETLTTVVIVVLSVLCVVLILPYLYICCIGFYKRKHSYKKNIAYNKYLKEARRALENCRDQIARGPNNDIEEAVNLNVLPR